MLWYWNGVTIVTELGLYLRLGDKRTVLSMMLSIHWLICQNCIYIMISSSSVAQYNTLVFQSTTAVRTAVLCSSAYHLQGGH